MLGYHRCPVGVNQIFSKFCFRNFGTHLIYPIVLSGSQNRLSVRCDPAAKSQQASGLHPSRAPNPIGREDACFGRSETFIFLCIKLNFSTVRAHPRFYCQFCSALLHDNPREKGFVCLHRVIAFHLGSAIGTDSHGYVANGLLFVSRHTPTDPATGKAPDGITAQAEHAETSPLFLRQQEAALRRSSRSPAF